MRRIINKNIAIFMITVMCFFMMPIHVFAAYDNVQIVSTESGYIVYIEGMEDKEFKYATSDGTDALSTNDISLNYINSVKDENGEGENSVAILDGTEKYLYVKEGSNTSVIPLDFSNSIDKQMIETVEGLTNTIPTEVIEIEERNEKIDQVSYIETTGGLKITDDTDASYEYVLKKLPDEKYSKLKEAIDSLNSSYEEEDMYGKIKFAKETYDIYQELISSASWQSIDNMQVLQPDDSQTGDEYVVLLKKVSSSKGTRAVSDNTTYDAKILVSKRDVEKPKSKTKSENKKRTNLLPRTGESLVLYSALAIIIIASVIVFIRMRNLKNKDNK